MEQNQMTTPNQENLAHEGLSCVEARELIDGLREELDRYGSSLMRVLSGHSTVKEMREDAAQTLGPWGTVD
jgi:hypothetical protein